MRLSQKKLFFRLLAWFIWLASPAASMAQLPPSYVPANGLVGWWPFNGNAQDGSGNGRHGNVLGPVLRPDRFGIPNRAYYFDGINDVITVAPPGVSFASGVTVSVWCKLEQGPGNAQFMVARGNDNNIGHFHVQYNQQSFPSRFGGGFNQWNNTPSVQGPTVYPTPHVQWYHVVYTYNNNVQILYVNCKEIARISINQQISANPDPIHFGNGFGTFNDTYRVRGLLDDIGIWNRALTHKEIKELYFASVLPATPPNTVFAQSACDRYTWPQNGRTYTQSGRYADTLTTACGCDSLVTLDLTIHPSRRDTITASICRGSAYAFQGSTYRDSGIYIARYNTVNGCDSSITLLLTVHPVYSDTLTDVICAGAVYNLPGGAQASSSGVYNFTLRSVNGCDSTVAVFLTVLPDSNYVRFMVDSIFPGQTYALPDGRTVDAAGVYVSRLRTVSGCDSIINTTLYPKSIQYELYIPDAFSPNEDRVNDTWQAYGPKDAILQLEVQVYDRWGEKVFESAQADFAWDGYFRDRPASAGTYVYVIKVLWVNSARPKVLTGTIALMR